MLAWKSLWPCGTDGIVRGKGETAKTHEKVKPRWMSSPDSVSVPISVRKASTDSAM